MEKPQTKLFLFDFPKKRYCFGVSVPSHWMEVAMVSSWVSTGLEKLTVAFGCLNLPQAITPGVLGRYVFQRLEESSISEEFVAFVRGRKNL